MKIGLDAKRAFHNPSGLGNYSRNLINGLTQIDDAEFEFFLFTPKASGTLFFAEDLPENFKVIESTSIIKPYWRSFSIDKDIAKNGIELFHGLSNELPFTLKNQNIKTTVTIHDLLYLRLPSLYPILDRNIYAHKAKRACEIAERVIATSKATKNDLIEYLNVPEDKIDIIYQSCSKSFFVKYSDKDKKDVRAQFNLPQHFVLCTGTLEVRKNQKLIVQAMSLIRPKDRLPIVLVGKDRDQAKSIMAMAKKLDVEVIILDNVPNPMLPLVYQCASLFVYPSIYEGFGIPVLEAMASKIPVISTEKTSMEEILHNPETLVGHTNQEALAEKMELFLSRDNSEMIQNNYSRAEEFTTTIFAQKMASFYKKL
jgi:glycosyltransferase involved in cell wall biosynthesis